MDNLAVGMIGAGNIATRHLANLDFLDGNRIAGICDLEIDRARALANQYRLNLLSRAHAQVAQSSPVLYPQISILAQHLYH